jgi:fumarate reductase flavoprotein subunit
VCGGPVTGPRSGRERIGCDALVLACNGYGGNREMVRVSCRRSTGAVWFGHDGNRGDALDWGEALGAESLHLGAYQGHGNVAHPDGILITWAVITEGGVQVNSRRAIASGRKPGLFRGGARRPRATRRHEAWAIFDTRIAGIARQFQDFKDAEAMGAIRVAEDIPTLARMTGLPDYALPTASRRGPDGPTPSVAAFRARRFRRPIVR